MNILVLTSAYPQPDDENEVVTPTVKYFCLKWAEAGHRIIVIHNNSRFPGVFYAVPKSIREKVSSKVGHNFPTKESRKPLAYVENGVRVYRLPMKKVIPYTRFRKTEIINQAEKIKKIIDQECFVPDMIISHWVNPQLEIVRELRKTIKAKTSLVFHADCKKAQIRKFDLKHTIKEFDAVGCRNESYAKKVKEALELNRLPFICYSGVPDHLAEAQMLNIDKTDERERHDFIYVGRLVQYKNVDVIINALHKKYPQGNFKLEIIGVGAEKERLTGLVNECGLQKQVVFHDQMPRDDVFKLMKESYCFIMISDHETFGMVYIEAMLAGCITVASKGGGVDGVIVDGVNGFLSEQGNVDDLVRTLTRIEEMSIDETDELRKRAVRTAFEYRDSQVAAKYLEDVLHWK